MHPQGGSEDTAGLEKMMEAMGGEGGMPGMGDMGGMPGMGAGRTPEDHKREVEALKAVRANCSKLVRLLCMFTSVDFFPLFRGSTIRRLQEFREISWKV